MFFQFFFQNKKNIRIRNYEAKNHCGREFNQNKKTEKRENDKMKKRRTTITNVDEKNTINEFILPGILIPKHFSHRLILP